VAALSKDNMTGEAVKTGGKYLCRLIMTAEKSIAEAVKTAGKTRAVFKQQAAVTLTVRRQQRIEGWKNSAQTIERTYTGCYELAERIMKRVNKMAKADIGLIGLAVMGENLILNMESKGLAVACFNRTVSKVDGFIGGRAKGKNIIGCKSIEELAASLKKPRKVMLMVKAGKAVDAFIEQLLEHLEAGDIIIDGGNSYFQDTIRRTKYVESKNKLYIGTGVSGGEEGALKGPSIMPGGSPKAWESVKPIFQKIAAHTDDGEACCDWVGEDGAGHFVKMVHNGIEYGDMQLICEIYYMMKKGLAMTNAEIHEVFAGWNEGELDSYLIEITRDILAYKDEEGNEVIDLILDTAGQKGTGKWAGIAALKLGQPLTLIGEAVFARCLSALKEERVNASKVLAGPEGGFTGEKKSFIADLRQALYASKIISYAQGYQLMRAAAKEYNWRLNNGGIALMWRGGCIIRSVFLGKIKEAFDENPGLVNLLLSPFFKKAVESAQPSWRRVVAAAVEMGIPIPAISSALAYYDGYRNERLPANLLQGQRDYFGAHTYERVDRPRGEFFHTNWTGRGGSTAASTYTV
jgi:6-phosphogluconate dehydrogenase